VEAHNECGGIGSLISEVIAEQALECRLVRCAAKQPLNTVTGSQSYLHRVNGLSSDAIVKAVIQALKG
jgi:transketolase C-terminal domain/subunit